MSLNSAHAASAWKPFHNAALHVSFRYPAGWTVMASATPGAGGQIMLTRQGRMPYALRLTVLPIRAAGSLSVTVKRASAYQRSVGDTSLMHLKWQSTRLGNVPAQAGVAIPSTEGGVGVSQGIFVTGWKGHVYELIISGYGHPVPSKLSSFPSIYFQILKTWRFS
jgi:hypothetical protein